MKNISLKRVIVFMLAITMVLGILPASVFADDDLIYATVGGNVITSTEVFRNEKQSFTYSYLADFATIKLYINEPYVFPDASKIQGLSSRTPVEHTANADGSITIDKDELKCHLVPQKTLNNIKYIPDLRDPSNEVVCFRIYCENFTFLYFIEITGDEEALAPAEALAKAREDALAEVNSYKNPDDYREAQKQEIEEILRMAVYYIRGEETIEGIAQRLETAKAELDAVKTDAQLTAQEEAAAAAALAKAKDDAIAELGEYADAEDYRDAQKEELAAVIEEATDAINAAQTPAEVEELLDVAKSAIDEIPTDAELTEQEEAAAAEALAKAKEEAIAELGEYADEEDYREAEKEELAAVIEEATDAINAAQTQAEVEELLDAAKSAIDEIPTDAELTAQEEAAAAEALAKAKEEAIAELETYKDPAEYREEQIAELETILEGALAAIDEAETDEEIAGIVDAAKAELDAVKTDAQLKAEEDAAKEESKDETGKANPSTGDNAVIIFAGIMMLTFMAAIVAIRKRQTR